MPESFKAPIRDPRYAPRRLNVERCAQGVILLHNPSPFDLRFGAAFEPLEHWAAKTPKAVWLAQRSGAGWRTLAFSEAAERTRQLAGGLREAGLDPGSPLLILARNSLDHALIAYAAMSQGVPIAPVSPQYGLAGADLSRLGHAFQLLRPKAIFVDDAARFSEALSADFLSGVKVIAGANPRPHDLLLRDLAAASPVRPVATGDDIAKLLLTSGSTGRPKAVIIRHRALAANAAQVTACFNDPEPPVVVNQSPWSHSLGANAILHMVLHRGGSLYIDEGAPVAGRFAPTVSNLRDIAPTYHNMVPAAWDLLATELERDEALARRFFSRVRVLQYGGAGLGQSTCDRIEAIALKTVGEHISFASGFGATETGPTAMNVHWPNLTMGLLGLPVPGTTIKLTPSGGRFELAVKGPQVSAGYYRAPEATADALDAEGFYRLGDAAKPLDPARPEAGLMFDGRISENFKLSSGTFVNVGSLRIAALSALNGLAVDAVVCGENQTGAGLLVFLNIPFCRQIAAGERELDAAPAVILAVRQSLERFNAKTKGAGGRISRALIAGSPPDADSGEITDKGYINQSLARSRRAADIARLYASDPDEAVLVFDR